MKLTYRAGAGLRVNIEQLIASRMLIQANSGGGKSRAIRQLLEETYGTVQHIVIDPEGEFHTLREKYSYVLAAKTGGEALASPKTAKLLCRRLMELGASAVLDLYELTPPERREFVRIFLSEMTGLPKTLWRPCLVVIDEAHTFCPERGHGESVSTDAVINFISLARKRGFCPVLATQRISKLHKDAAAELNNKMIGRTGLDVDVDRAAKELGFDKEKKQTLPRLEPGQFYVYGPAISPQVTIVSTGDVSTTHPQPGQLSGAPTPPPAKVKAMLAQLGDLPKEAEEEARTVADQQRVIGQLRAELRKLERDGKTVEKTVTVVDQAAVDRAVAAAVKKDRQLIDGMLRSLAAQSKALATIPVTIERVQRELADVHEVFESRVADAPPTSTKRVFVQAPQATNRARSTVPAAADPESTLGVGKTARRMVAAMQQLLALGVTEPTKATVAGWVGVSHTTGTFSNQMRELRDAGLIEPVNGESIRLTDVGAEAYNDAPPIQSLDELHSIWRTKLGGTTAKLFDVLVEHYPNPISKADLAAAVGVSHETGTFSNQLRFMRTPGIMRDVSKTEVVATELLFPMGLS